MKLCDTCIYRNNVEQLKPCIIYRDNCEYYEKESDDMTREQAIKWLKDMLKNFDLPQEQYQTALDVALEALEQEPCGDAISRQYLLDNCVVDKVTMPYVPISKIQEAPPVTPQPCGDLISRQAVDTLVDELARAISDERCCISRGRSTASIMQDILDLPSVNPQEPKWIPVSERLPEDRDWYLGIFRESDTGWINSLPFVCDYVGHETKATTKEHWILRGFTDMDEHIDYYFNLECVAWMPLPEPYKAESEVRNDNNKV